MPNDQCINTSVFNLNALNCNTTIQSLCYLHGQGVPGMFGRVWLLTYADSFLEPQMRAGCQVWTKSGPTTPGEELNKRCCPLPDIPIDQGNDLTCMKRCSSRSDHFSVSLSGWPGQKSVFSCCSGGIFETLCSDIVIIAATVC